jgi:hypothetical protein
MAYNPNDFNERPTYTREDYQEDRAEERRQNWED